MAVVLKRPRLTKSGDRNPSPFSNIIQGNSLKCIVCKNLVFSPVTSCQGGHLFCGLCGRGQTICNHGGCEEEPLTACESAESILKSADPRFKCSNAKLGCRTELKACEVKEHSETCDYRPVECCETKPRTLDCKRRSCTLSELFPHLKKFHKCGDLRFPKAKRKQNPSVLQFVAHFKAAEICGNGFERGETDYFRYDKKIFLSHMARQNGTICWWITIIGSEKLAKKYSYVMKFRSRTGPKFEWTLPVHSVRYMDFKKVKETGAFAAFKKSSIKGYEAKGVCDGREYDYIWGVEIQMNRK